MSWDLQAAARLGEQTPVRGEHQTGSVVFFSVGCAQKPSRLLHAEEGADEASVSGARPHCLAPA